MMAHIYAGVLLVGSLLLPSSVAQPAPGYTTSCQYSTGGVSYDLSSLTLQTGFYQVGDVRAPDIYYQFNICGDVPPPLTPASECSRLGGSNAEAWQVDINLGRPYDCYRLGWGAGNGWNFTITDPVYPARGVSLVTGGGESTQCSFSGGVRVNRTLSIDLQCAPVPQSSLNATSYSVFEQNVCNYNVQIKSLAGCPTSCLTGLGSSICSNSGRCGYNSDAKRGQCFCFTGYQGTFCESQISTDTGVSTESVILIVVCIVLAAVLFLVGFMLLRLRKLQINPASYDQLEGKFNELGMLA